MTLAAVAALAAPGRADQRYSVTGNDSYRIGRNDLRTQIAYAGVQTLSVRRENGSVRFTAQAHYSRADSTGSVPAQATFVQVMTPQGELQDRTDLDPDYLTVLNQPFAIELDPATLHDLLRLRGRIPFVFPAPMTGGTLRGYLARGAIGRVNHHPVLAVGFDASGPMVGPLPDHAALSISGTMRMRGTAYYALRGDPLLLALEESLTISGTLNDRGQRSPVTIVYRRAIKADVPASQQLEANATPAH